MGARDPRVDAYIAKSAPFARPILRHLRAVVHAGCPTVVEAIKWGMPAFEHGGILCGMGAFQSHCTFWFWKGALIVKGDRAKQAEAMGQFGRVTRVADLPPKRVLVGYVKQAAKRRESGERGPERSKSAGPKRSPRTPADLAAALRLPRHARAAATWAAFAPGHRREYVEWIVEAKRPGTRARRLATTLDWLAKGRPQRWRYERKR